MWDDQKPFLSHPCFYLYEENLFRFQWRGEIYYIFASKLPTGAPDSKSYFTKNEALKFYCHEGPSLRLYFSIPAKLVTRERVLNFADPIVSNTSSMCSIPCLASFWQSCLKFKKFSTGKKKILRIRHMPSLTSGSRHRPPHPAPPAWLPFPERNEGMYASRPGAHPLSFLLTLSIICPLELSFPLWGSESLNILAFSDRPRTPQTFHQSN